MQVFGKRETKKKNCYITTKGSSNATIIFYTCVFEVQNRLGSNLR